MDLGSFLASTSGSSTNANKKVYSQNIYNRSMLDLFEMSKCSQELYNRLYILILLKEEKKARALYDFEAAEDNELTFKAGEIGKYISYYIEKFCRGM